MKFQGPQRVSCVSWLSALFAGFILAASASAVEEAKKEPAKPQEKKEQETLKKALDHLKQYAALVQQLREAASRQQCANNLRQMSLAVHNFQADTKGAFPNQGSMFYHILPYMEQNNLYRWFSTRADRLGAPVEPLNAALASQLDLRRGLVVGSVAAKSGAAKAGLKAHDILLEINGKPVPGDLAGFAKVLDGIKAKTPVDAVVLRKGKKVTLKGFTLAEASSLGSDWGNYLYGKPNPMKVYVCPSDPVADGTSNTIMFAEKYTGTTGSSAAATTFRRDDRFTTRYQEGSLIITVTGKLAGGKARVAHVKVQDGGVEHRYASLDKVPAEYQDKARDLVAVSEKGQGKIEILK